MTESARSTQSFGLRFTRPFALAARPFGVVPAKAGVTVAGAELHARYGPWTVRTPLANIRSCTVTGPYAVAKVIGPARLTLSDRGLTFASNPDLGAFLQFTEPVRGIFPGGWPRHPNLTVTVADPHALAAALRR